MVRLSTMLLHLLLLYLVLGPSCGQDSPVPNPRFGVVLLTPPPMLRGDVRCSCTLMCCCGRRRGRVRVAAPSGVLPVPPRARRPLSFLFNSPARTTCELFLCDHLC